VTCIVTSSPAVQGATKPSFVAVRAVSTRATQKGSLWDASLTPWKLARRAQGRACMGCRTMLSHSLSSSTSRTARIACARRPAVSAGGGTGIWLAEGRDSVTAPGGLARAASPSAHAIQCGLPSRMPPLSAAACRDADTSRAMLEALFYTQQRCSCAEPATRLASQVEQRCGSHHGDEREDDAQSRGLCVRRGHLLARQDCHGRHDRHAHARQRDAWPRQQPSKNGLLQELHRARHGARAHVAPSKVCSALAPRRC